MDQWLPLLGAIAGAAIAIAGQASLRRAHVSDRTRELLLDSCAQLVAANEDFRNRFWEERMLGQAGRVDEWDITSARLALARVQLLSTSAHLDAALVDLQDAGQKLGGYWRRGDIEEDELEQRYQRYKSAIATFVATAASCLR